MSIVLHYTALTVAAIGMGVLVCAAATMDLGMGLGGFVLLWSGALVADLTLRG